MSEFTGSIRYNEVLKGADVRLSIMIGVVAIASLAISPAEGQEAPLPDVDQFGPQVGETVPDFSLVDQNGQTRDLRSIMGPNGAMLVFSRSASW